MPVAEARSANGTTTGAGTGAAGTSTTTTSVLNPQAPAVNKKSETELTVEDNKSAVDTANSERNAVYANPASTEADKAAADRKLQKAQNTLESSQKNSDDSALSVKGIFTKAAGDLADGLLSALGLENSIFSDTNTYNKAATSIYNHYNNKYS